MRATTSDTAATVRTLVAAIDNERVRELLVELLLSGLTASAPPAHQDAPRRRPPRKRGRQLAARTGKPAPSKASGLAERRREYNRRYAAKRRAAERAKLAHAASRAARSKSTARAGKPHKANSGDNNASAVAPRALTPQAFWCHAEKLVPGRPWLAVTREFDVGDLIAQACYRDKRLPPHVGPMAVTQFLELNR